ncbi:AsnC family protein [Nocardia sp. NPDC004750]
MHALHIDGRAPFSRIAAVLGVSDQTVAPAAPQAAFHRATTGGRPAERPAAGVGGVVRPRPGDPRRGGGRRRCAGPAAGYLVGLPHLGRHADRLRHPHPRFSGQRCPAARAVAEDAAGHRRHRALPAACLRWRSGRLARPGMYGKPLSAHRFHRCRQ